MNLKNYVGHSNGCRTALSSLKNWSTSGKNNAGNCFNLQTGQYDIQCNLLANPVDTLVAVGCPGNFTTDPKLKELISAYGQQAIDHLGSQNESHVTIGEFGTELCRFAEGADIVICDIINDFLVGQSQISVNLFHQYYYFMNSSNDIQPGSNLNVNKFAIIHGYGMVTHDGIVTTMDSQDIYNNVNAPNKKRLKVLATHKGLPNMGVTKDITSRILNNQSLSLLEKRYNLLNSTGGD